MLLSEAKQILKKNGYKLSEAHRDIPFKRNRISDIKDEQEMIVARNRVHLMNLIKREVKENGPECSLNHIDVSKITDMDGVFFNCPDFNGDISKWDVSNVENMSSMFSYSNFNGDISKWDVSNVTDMSNMFYDSKFNRDISKWDVSNVTDMHGMFEKSEFNGDISNWKLNKRVNWGDLAFPEDSCMYEKLLGEK